MVSFEVVGLVGGGGDVRGLVVVVVGDCCIGDCGLVWLGCGVFGCMCSVL